MPRTVMCKYNIEIYPLHLSVFSVPWLPHVVYLQQGCIMWGCSSGESGKFIAEGRERIGSMAMWSRAVIVALLSCALLFPSLLMAAEEDQPKDFEYFQIWVSQDGETHIAECKMKGFNYTAYSSLPQYLRSDFGGEPVKFVLTELPVGLAQPLHNTPIVQFVATLSGSWYVHIPPSSLSPNRISRTQLLRVFPNVWNSV